MRRQAQEEYVEYVSGRLGVLRQLAFLLCGDEHRADDIVQLTIEKLYLRWANVSAVEHLDQYVRRMLVRTFLDERRRPWARIGLFARAPEVAPAAGPEVETRLVIRAALARVPRRQQAVLVLRYLCDLPVDEVAAILSCSPGTVKSQTARGLAAMRQLVGDDLQRTV
ncbi:SigE family RNA polymerase sigma factor [Dactylosporangium vinaceum]|uniref:SigE family RNA polymerase sigma factor n=1 Tax=Dactylosporangium vinaceum TaxID=53362 RepID=A0ABV5M4S3_9ACTN|nr:SigE family RNA polymerase sigma factor [Dactylosporangium vinaceum]UAB96070.1 SigE family RNA polymerase sigma factor [Dactylosporangium vinaceum]